VTKEGHAYAARIYENGRMRRLGTYSTPVQAALCYARYIGADQAAAETAKHKKQIGARAVMGASTVRCTPDPAPAKHFQAEEVKDRGRAAKKDSSTASPSAPFWSMRTYIMRAALVRLVQACLLACGSYARAPLPVA
jgi:hypothetical protein